MQKFYILLYNQSDTATSAVLQKIFFSEQSYLFEQVFRILFQIFKRLWYWIFRESTEFFYLGNQSWKYKYISKTIKKVYRFPNSTYFLSTSSAYFQLYFDLVSTISLTYYMHGYALLRHLQIYSQIFLFTSQGL